MHFVKDSTKGKMYFVVGNNLFDPDDIIPPGGTAAQSVVDISKDRSEAWRKTARRFLQQWPAGPQLPKRPPGRPRTEGDQVKRTFKISKKVYDRIPGNKSEFIRDAVEQKLKGSE